LHPESPFKETPSGPKPPSMQNSQGVRREEPQQQLLNLTLLRGDTWAYHPNGEPRPNVPGSGPGGKVGGHKKNLNPNENPDGLRVKKIMRLDHRSKCNPLPLPLCTRKNLNVSSQKPGINTNSSLDVQPNASLSKHSHSDGKRKSKAHVYRERPVAFSKRLGRWEREADLAGLGAVFG
jgi:hypothetical protein